MKTNLLTIFKHSWGLMMSTTQTWESLKLEDKPSNNDFKGFVLPWTVLVSAFVFTFTGLYGTEKVFETAFIMSLVTAISLIGSFYLTRAFANSFFRRNLKEYFSDAYISKITAYSFAVIFTLKIVTAVMPSLFFLQILNIYTLYIVWEGCHVFFDMNEDERGKTMLLIGLCIIFMPSIISRVILMMLPAF